MLIFTVHKLVVVAGMLLIVNLIGPSISYKPVVIIHGMFDHENSLLPLRDRIMQKHKGTNVTVTVINKLHRWRSMVPMWDQVKTFKKMIRPIMQSNPDGIHLIGYSQGGLIARALIQSMKHHNVNTFISLSSPQGGLYGDKFLSLYFPDRLKDNAWKLFYRESGQHISVGNYWRDPHHLEQYYNHSNFLPKIDNEITSEDSRKFKNNFKRVKKLILIGGPNDGVISPWESSHFGCYDPDENVLTMKQRDLYKNNLFGLRTLDKENKILKLSVPGVSHFQWHKSFEVMDNHIIPFLD